MQNIRFQIGITLSLIGVSLAMLLNYVLPITQWSPIIMLLSVILLIDFSNFNNILQLPPVGVNRILLCFQLLMLFYWCISYQGRDDTFKYLSFHLYVVALIFVINTNRKLLKVDFSKMLFIFSSLLSVIFASFHFLGLYELHRLMTGEKYVLEVFTMDMAAYANLVICMIFFSSQKHKMNILLLLLLFIDFYVITQSGKRSYFISIFFAFVLFAYKTKKFTKTLTIGFLIFIITISISDVAQTTVYRLFDKTVSGWFDVYGNTNMHIVLDENSSSSIRAFSLRKTIVTVNNDFSLFNYLFGGGYLFAWIDNPLLESYLDMGFVGLVLYVYLIILYPLKRLKDIQLQNKNEIILIIIASVSITVSITNHNPYQYFFYTPLCILGGYEISHYRLNNLFKLLTHIRSNEHSHI